MARWIIYLGAFEVRALVKASQWRNEWEVCLLALNQWAWVGGQRSQKIRPDHQIFNDTDHQLPQRGAKVGFWRAPPAERSGAGPLRLKILALWCTLTGSDGLLPMGLPHWLLHLRDHQVGGGEELVCGHHQPDRTAAHHHVLRWVSLYVCMILGWFGFFFLFLFYMWFWFLPSVGFESVFFLFSITQEGKLTFFLFFTNRFH